MISAAERSCRGAAEFGAEFGVELAGELVMGDCVVSPRPGKRSEIMRGAAGASGDEVVSVKLGAVFFLGCGMPPGVRGLGSLCECWPFVEDSMGLRGERAGIEMLSWRDCRPGSPVKGLMTSLTTDVRRSRSVLGVGSFAPLWDSDERGEGSAKLDGVRGRDTGD